MPRHPFDARRSGRDPFPCFAAAMAEHASDAGSASGSDSGSDTAETLRNVAGGCTCDGAVRGSGGRCSCCATGSSLDWSIDGLATLLPRAFSPPAFQFPPHRLRRRRRWSTGTTASLDGDFVARHDETDQQETPLRSATFFEDEQQFRVLRTPAEVLERERQQVEEQSKPPTTETAMAVGEYAAAWRSATSDSPARWRELHRRCVDTIQVCEARVRERQQRLARLPIPATKLALRHHRIPKRYGAGSASSNRSGHATERIPLPREPLTPVVPTRLSFGSIDLSPIPQDSANKTHLSEPTTPTPVTRAHANASTGGSYAASTFSSPALSSIAEHAPDVLTPSFASLQFSPSREGAQIEDENKENTSSTPSASSLQTGSLLGGSGPLASSSSSPSFASPISPLSMGDNRHDAESIAARQLSFVAAIEEEAKERDSATPNTYRRRPPPSSEANAAGTMESSSASVTSTPPPSNPRTPIVTKCPPPATSMASIYKEARALGLTEPTAQWEYVQLIRRQTARERSAKPATRVSF